MKKKEVKVTTTMSKAYQITVPSVIRKALGLMPGDPVDFRLEGVAQCWCEQKREKKRLNVCLRN